MEYLIFIIMCGLITILSVKIHLLQKGLKEIDNSLADILSQDTNRQITLSSRNRSVCRLASQLNIHLGQLRKKQLKYTNGDRELKEAITNISHDLRTPLTAISGYLELLEREACPGKNMECPEKKSHSTETRRCSGTETHSADIRRCSETETHSADIRRCYETGINSAEILRCLGVIRNRTEHMKQLTEELFRYSLALSVPEETPQLLSLNRVLEECLLSFYEALRSKKITPVVSMPEEPVMRTLDPAALSRIFQNVLGNAVKYSSGDLTVRLAENGTITCSNTAPNLNPLMAKQLFDRYYTVETVSSPNSEGSTGLGLSIARLLTERLGGEISAACIQQTPDLPLQNPAAENRLEITIRFPAR